MRRTLSATLELGAVLTMSCLGATLQALDAGTGLDGGRDGDGQDAAVPASRDSGWVDLDDWDSGVDAGLDATPDAGSDATADAGSDATPDAGSDTSPDAGIDAGIADGVIDAGPCVPLRGVVSTLAQGTYCVIGDVIVPSGTTLDIPAGTTFIVKGRYHFGRDPAMPDAEPPAILGSGSIHAIGTAAQPIVFRGETPSTGWFGIVVSHSHDTVHFEYVTIRDTYKDDRNPNSRIWRRGGALGSYVNTKGTIIRHCTFTNNRAYSVAGAIDLNSHGQWPNPGPVEITDSLFENNSCECGTYGFSSADLCGGGAIRVSHVGGDATLVKIRNNVFRNNQSKQTGSIEAYGGAIGGFDAHIVIGPGNRFENNQASTGDGALSCAHLPQVGTIISAVDPSCVFSNNTPDNGCGQ